MARYLLDEDVNPEVAAVARGQGLDVRSIYELGREGLSDRRQLEGAAADGRALVTYNRDDYRELTVEFFQARKPHSGVVIIPHSLPDDRPERVAAALEEYERARAGEALEPWSYDFLPRP